MPDNSSSLRNTKRFARRLLTIGENRIELLMVEVQEERERLLQGILLALCVAGFGLLAGVALTGAIVVLLWELLRFAALLALTTLYGATDWRWCCTRNSLESIASMLSASWTKRTKPAHILKPCAAKLTSNWWWNSR